MIPLILLKTVHNETVVININHVAYLEETLTGSTVVKFSSGNAITVSKDLRWILEQIGAHRV